MIQQDLAFVANTLLSLCESDAQRPFYTDEAFAHKLKLAETRDMAFGTVLQGRPHDVLLQAEINDIVDRSRLTPRQRAVLEHRLNGWTFEEIGRRFGHTKQGAQSIFSQAVKKLMRSWNVYRYRGLSEAYLEDVRRGRV